MALLGAGATTLVLRQPSRAYRVMTEGLNEMVLPALRTTLGRATVLTIAHRLDTLKSSDVLYYLAHGRVIEVAGAESLDHKAVDELLARVAALAAAHRTATRRAVFDLRLFSPLSRAVSYTHLTQPTKRIV